MPLPDRDVMFRVMPASTRNARYAGDVNHPRRSFVRERSAAKGTDGTTRLGTKSWNSRGRWRKNEWALGVPSRCEKRVIS